MSTCRTGWTARSTYQTRTMTIPTRRMVNLLEKRNHQITDEFSKTARFIIDYCIKNDIGRIIVGMLQAIQLRYTPYYDPFSRREEDKNCDKTAKQLWIKKPAPEIETGFHVFVCFWKALHLLRVSREGTDREENAGLSSLLGTHQAGKNDWSKDSSGAAKNFPWLMLLVTFGCYFTLSDSERQNLRSSAATFWILSFEIYLVNSVCWFCS